MMNERQFQKPISDTGAFYVIGNTPHDHFENLVSKLLKVPKEEVDKLREQEKQEREKRQTG